MLFNTPIFGFFLFVALGLYWWSGKGGLKIQNLVVLGLSYFFYGWWDPRFLILIAISTLVDFVCGQQIASAKGIGLKKRWLAVSLSVNLGMLAYFKYANFFIENWVHAWSAIGVSMESWTINVILPVGISFYTFQTLSYTIDVYRGRLEPTKNVLAFASFVAFFPQLVAGPIEKARDLLPQMTRVRIPEPGQIWLGVQLLIWGMMKKVLVADEVGLYVDQLYARTNALDFWESIFTGVLVSVQIYADFSGYSDIALGTAALMGFSLSKNWDFPLFSRTPIDFWNKWHITLNDWFRDYLFRPMLRMRRPSVFWLFCCLFVVFFLSGLWHGPRATFIVWGLYMGICLFVFYLIKQKTGLSTAFPRTHTHLFPDIREAAFIRINTWLLMQSAVFFRAQSLGEAMDIYAGFLHPSAWNLQAFFTVPGGDWVKVMVLVVCFLGIEWMWWRGAIRLPERPKQSALLLGIGLLAACIINMDHVQTPFVYFQF